MRATESARSENARNLSRLFNESEYSINNLSRTVAGNVSQNQTAHDTPGKSADASVSALTDIKAAPMPPLDESTERAAIPERFQRYRPKLIK
jgi:hypothetical protein